MIKKTIGTILIIGGGIFLVFLISHGLVFPHIIGPITILIIGVLLVALKGKK